MTAQIGAKGRILNNQRLVGEDYFRVLKENKEIEAHQKKRRSNKGQPAGFESISKISKISAGAGGAGGAKTTEELPIEEMDDEQLMNEVILPTETMYLIDKVVRQRSKVGPIGIDNSELINLEIEQEFKDRN